MLERLRIIDFAVARDVAIDLGPGLNVFTGETGAGKSLVVDALAFLFGARRGREVIVSGAARATVVAELLLDGAVTRLERSVSVSGRSSARINGEPATVDDVRERFGDLVEVHGQAGQLAVLRPAVQLSVLDSFAGLSRERSEVGALVRELRETRRRMAALAGDARERERLAGQLEFEWHEIRDAALVSGEDVALRSEHQRLANSRLLIECAALAMQVLEGASLGEAVRAISDIAVRDESAVPLRDAALSIDASIADLTREMRHYVDALDEDPERLAAVEERLDLIARLCRKYGDTVDDVLRYGDEAVRRLAELAGSAQSVEELAAQEERILRQLSPAAESLSLARRAKAGELVAAISGELRHLLMPGAMLAVGFACEEDANGPVVHLPDYEVVVTEREPGEPYEPQPRACNESGVDRIEFLASFNPGESPRPLGTVASGGETSRFLLALASVAGNAGPARVVVFDEVDEGVGGRAGNVVGEALVRLARERQVLCITHLPQVAAYGDRHFVVAKQTEGERTLSRVQMVTGDERVRELAAMLGGPSEANLAAARDLLDRVNAGA